MWRSRGLIRVISATLVFRLIYVSVDVVRTCKTGIRVYFTFLQDSQSFSLNLVKFLQQSVLLPWTPSCLQVSRSSSSMHPGGWKTSENGWHRHLKWYRQSSEPIPSVHRSRRVSMSCTGCPQVFSESLLHHTDHGSRPCTAAVRGLCQSNADHILIDDTANLIGAVRQLER